MIKEKFIKNLTVKRSLKKEKQFYIRGFCLTRFSLRQLVSANAHLGYEVNRWNPEMKVFLWGIRSNMHILNLQETSLVLRKAFAFVTMLIKLRKLIVFASENKHIDHVLKKIVLTDNQCIASNRWIGGIVTNFKEIRKNIRILTTNYNTKTSYTLLSTRRKKLKVALEGLINLYQLPSFVLVLNGVKSKWGMNEITSKNIPCAAIIDSVAMNKADFLIPGNVYGFATQVLYVKLFLIVIKNARLQEILTFVDTKKVSDFVTHFIQK